MLTLPELDVHFPTTAAEAVHLATTLPRARYIAGGTDLMPNLKHRLYDVEHLIGLSRIDMGGVDSEGDHLVLGAGITLDVLSADATVKEAVPALAEAAALVGGPLHRSRGTLGGNVMLDTRCLFYNQTEAWREALGFCLKRSGDYCHVIGSKKTCVAAQSSDTVPMLVALGATLGLVTPDGPLEVAIADLYSQDGRTGKHLRVPDTSLLTTIRVPARPASVFRKVRRRNAIDFPQLNVAIVARSEGGTVSDLRIVVGAVMPKPKLLRKMELAVGTTLDDDVIAVLSEAAFKQVRPQTSIQGDVGWRREMARVEVKRGLEALRQRL